MVGSSGWPSVLISAVCIWLQLITCVYSRGWVLEYNNASYAPMDICMFIRSQGYSFYWTCDTQQSLNLAFFDGYSCSANFLGNIPEPARPFDCDTANQHPDLDYIQYTIWDLGTISATAQCNNLQTLVRPNEWALVINKCMYLPRFGVYGMGTCTDTKWVTSYYSDQNCSSSALITRNNQPTECKHNETFIEITGCSTAMNSVQDQFGYMQYRKDSWLQPLHQCFIVSHTFSYILTCDTNDVPYIYYWSASNCGDLNNASAQQISPISYSCSPNTYDYVTVDRYDNNNNCSALNTSIANHTSDSYIVNHCFNWFDSNNVMKSEFYYCNETTFWSVAYEAPDCDASMGSSIPFIWSEHCSNNESTRYIIDCQMTGLVDVTTSTEQPTSTAPTAPTEPKTPAPTSINARRIYVTADGQDDYDCRYNGIDCGTFFYASFAAHRQYEEYNLSAIEIVIQGQNPVAIQAQLAALETGKHTNPCLPHEANDLYTPFETITYTFDPDYIQSLSDWYNASLCENHNGDIWNDFFSSAKDTGSTPFTFIVNNLIIDSYTFEGRRNQPFYIANVISFICNNCVFRDLVINYTHHDKPTDDRSEQQPTLFLVENIQLTDCVIDNIQYIPSATVDEYSYDFSFMKVDSVNSFTYTYHSYSLSMSNTTVTSLDSLSSFAYLVVSAGDLDFFGVISDSVFSDISVIDALINYNQDYVSTLSSSLYILNTNFLDISHGSILYAFNSNSHITISNVSITTSQTVPQYVAVQESIGRDDLDYYSLFVFDSDADEVDIADLHILYQYAHELDTRCVSAYASSTLTTVQMWLDLEYLSTVENDFFHFHYYCEHPMQLIDNEAVINLHGLYASNDITDATINVYREYIQQELDLWPFAADRNRTVYIQLAYDAFATQDSAMIYNGNELNIDSLYAYAYGVHPTLILNVDGTLNINDMVAVPDTFCTDPSAVTCVFDADALHLEYWIRFGQDSRCENREMHVFNSYLYGAQVQSILVGAGYAYLHNVTIQMSTSAVVTSSSALYVEISSSKMLDIGTYYASSTKRLQQLQQIFMPFLLHPLQVVIKDTLFSYVSPFQFDLFDATNYWSSIVDDAFESETRTISLFNNVFQINDENVLTSYPSNSTLHYILDNEDLFSIDAMLNPNNSFVEMMSEQLSQYFINDATFLIPDYAEVQMINNIFTLSSGNTYVDQAVMTEKNVPWMLFDHNTSTACLSGNEFINFALWVKTGTISSCVKNGIAEYIETDSCFSYGTFGAISESALELNDGKPNVFNVSTDEIDTIIRADDGAVIALENNQINIDVDDDVDVLNMMSGDYLLLNTELNAIGDGDGNILVNADNCEILCFSRIDKDFISALHVTCSSDTMDTFAESVPIDTVYSAYTASLFPQYIDIFPADSIKNDQYAPGQKMKLNYSLYDAFENQVDQELITDPIIISYSFHAANASRLLPDFQIIIDENGECSQCVDGITFSSITLQSVGQKYSFFPSVGENQLFARIPLNITITDCPMGYGSTGTEVCDVCNRGYFNLFLSNTTADSEIINVCLYCNEELLNGVSCPGASNVILSFNYWASIYRYSTLSESILDVDPNAYIVSRRCPPSYCCQLENGCNLLTDDEYLCASNRDFESPLCGQCRDGYSELFGTNGCGECERDYWERLLLPLVYGLLIAVYILYMKSNSIDNPSKEKQPGKCKSCIKQCRECSCLSSCDDDKNQKMQRDEFLSCLQYMMNKGVIYYFQAMSYILTTSHIQSALYGFVELFNLNVFSFTASSSNNTGYCLFKEMNMTQKIAIQLITTCLILFFSSLPFMCGFCRGKARDYICCCLKNRELHFGKTIIAVMLICVGQILSVLLRLLACRQVGTLSVHYFFGAEECYDAVWIISLCCLMFVFVAFFTLFGWIWYRQRNGNADEEESLAYYSTIKPFKDEYWWWECALFIRRSLMAITFIVFDSKELKICLNILLMLYLLVHVNVSPFKWKSVNTFESALILCTAICIFVDNSYSSESEAEMFGDVLISLLILFPIFWYLGFVIVHHRALCRGNRSGDFAGKVGAESPYDEGNEDDNVMVAAPQSNNERAAVGTNSKLSAQIQLHTLSQ